MSWDWRGQPNLDDLDRIVANMSGTGRMLRIHQADTGGDQCGILVTDEDLTQEQVNERWRAWWSPEPVDEP